MENREFKEIREKLYDVQVPVDADIWNGIESGLRRRRIRRVLLYASSAAAILIAALFIFTANPQEPHKSSLVAQAQQVQQANEKTSTIPVIPADEPIDAEPAPMSAHKASPSANAQTSGSATHVAAAQEVAAQAPAEDPQNAIEAAAPAASIAETAGQNGKGEEKPAEKQENKNAQTLFNLNGAEDYVAGISAKERGYAVKISSGVIPGTSASVQGGIIKASSAGAGNISHSHNIEQVSDTKYSLPVNLGVQFQFPIGENAALGIGLNYTMLRSKYDCLINKKKFNIKQTLHYIGVPVNVYGLVAERNNFRFYVNGGATLEKGIRAVYDLKSYDQHEHNSSSIDGMQFSVNAGLGAEYLLGNTVGLYLEPNIVYYFDSDVPHSIRTDQPLQVKAELGFRFRF